MTRKINRLADAQPILETIHTDLIGSIHSAFGDWLNIREYSNTLGGGPINYKPRTKAGLIHDHIEKYNRTNFSGQEHIIVDDFNGVFGLVLQNDLFIRFKKMDNSYSIRNLNTSQHVKYMKQARFPDSRIPDKTWSEIKGIYVACWIGDTLEWVDEFGKYTAEQAVFDFDAKEDKEAGEIEKRIKVKRGRKDDPKTGTNNS